MATGNLFKRAAAYRKTHKNLTQAQAVKAVAKMGRVTKKVSGTVKKKVSGTRKGTTRRKRIGELPVAVANSLAGVKRSVKKHVSLTQRQLDTRAKKYGVPKRVKEAEFILKTIDVLERHYKSARDRYGKEMYARAINSEHDKLDRLIKQF